MTRQRATQVKDAELARNSPCRMFHKTKLCQFHQQGRCQRGNACLYAHGDLELAPIPDLALTRLCPDFLGTGFCSKGMDCNFAHSKDELKRPARRKHVRQVVDARASVATTPLCGRKHVQGTENMFELQMLQGILKRFQTQLDPLEERLTQLSKEYDAEWSRASTVDIPEDCSSRRYSLYSDDDSWVSEDVYQEPCLPEKQDVSVLGNFTLAAFNVCVKNTFIGVVDEPAQVLRRVSSAPGSF